MSLPAGIITATLTFGPLGDYLGVVFPDASVTIEADADIVWADTGQPLMRSALVVVAVDGSGSIDLPATDQAGFINRDGTITGWSYTATTRVHGRADVVTVFQLPTDGATGVVVDLDVLR